MPVRFIVRKTLIDLSGWIRTPVLITVGLLVPMLYMASDWHFNARYTSFCLEAETFHMMSRFLGINFIWTTGLFLAFLVAANAAGAISKEANDGTLLTLVSKPVSRRQVVLGKLGGIALNALLLVAITLVLEVLLLWLVLPLSVPAMTSMLSTIPWLLLYSLLVILFFGTLAMALSASMESQVKIMVIGMTAILFFFLFGLLTNVLGLYGESEIYSRFHLYLIDGAYNLGNAFSPILSGATGGELLPRSELGTFDGFAGIFEGGRGESYGIEASAYSAKLANYVSPVVSIVILVVASALFLWLAMRAIDRKDVS